MCQCHERSLETGSIIILLDSLIQSAFDFGYYCNTYNNKLKKIIVEWSTIETPNRHTHEHSLTHLACTDTLKKVSGLISLTHSLMYRHFKKGVGVILILLA